MQPAPKIAPARLISALRSRNNFADWRAAGGFAQRVWRRGFRRDMATRIAAPLRRAKPVSPDRFERVLAVGAIILLWFVLAALARGHAHWGQIPLPVWGHLVTMITALALTPIMLLRRRGDNLHRLLGTIWVVAMILTALDTFLIRSINHGQFSFIHILSAWVLIQVPIIWWSAKTHSIDRHRSTVRGMVTGALLIAGFFTFPFNRMLGQFLFG
jgi:uncharacterized membrane protein